jgi:hypothetical protein
MRSAEMRLPDGQGGFSPSRKPGLRRGTRRAAKRPLDLTLFLVDDINAARVALFVNLAGKGAQQGLPLDWPGRFFKRSARAPKPTQTTVPASP